MEKSHRDEGGDFAGMSANVHLSLPSKLEQNKPLMVTFAEDLSKASLHHVLWERACLEFTHMGWKAERTVSGDRDANTY